MSPFETKAAVKRAAKKAAKLARREERTAAGRAGSLREPEPPTLRPLAIGFGSFERHTTGFGWGCRRLTVYSYTLLNQCMN